MTPEVPGFVKTIEIFMEALIERLPGADWIEYRGLILFTDPWEFKIIHDLGDDGWPTGSFNLICSGGSKPPDLTDEELDALIGLADDEDELAGDGTPGPSKSAIRPEVKASLDAKYAGYEHRNVCYGFDLADPECFAKLEAAFARHGVTLDLGDFA